MRPSLIAVSFAVSFALGLGGCTPELCERNSDCASGQVCTAVGRCAVPGDAGGDGQSDAAATTAGGDAVIDGEDIIFADDSGSDQHRPAGAAKEADR